MSSSTNQTLVLPNPLTPLAFLDPTSAYQSSVTQYTSIGSLAVLIWDILDNTIVDYHMIVQGRFNFSLVVYLISRIAVLGYTLESAIFNTAPVGHCVAFDNAVNAWCPFALVCTAYLFLQRVLAVYNKNKIVSVFFYVTWVGLLAATILVPVGIRGGSIGPTMYCEDATIANYVAIVEIMPLAYDTLVWAAISWRIFRSAAIYQLGVGESFLVYFQGKYLPNFTKSILLDGQIYYLITLIFGVGVAVLQFSPGIPTPFRWLANDPYIVIVNIMACRVYRRTRLGLIREVEISTTAMKKNQATLTNGPSSSTLASAVHV